MGNSGARCQHSIIWASSFLRHSSFGFRHYPDSARVNCCRIMNDLKFAFRQLLKNPGFTAVAVLTLALGIGANSAIFSIVRGVLLKPLPYREQEKLVTLWERNPQRGVEQEFVTPPNYADWREQSRVLGQMAYWNGVQQMNL